jgi:hypothetical protein
MQDKTTDVATVAGDKERIDFANKAESLLRSVLIALGYDNADKLTPTDLLTSVTAWVSMLRYAKLDTFGRYAAIWWEAAKLLFATHHMSIVTERATEAMHAFVRMFPPTISMDEESERDTINDLAALSKELDGQTEIAAALLSERDALLRANEHHAGEVVALRKELAAARALPLTDYLAHAIESIEATLFTTVLVNGKLADAREWIEAVIKGARWYVQVKSERDEARNDLGFTKTELAIAQTEISKLKSINEANDVQTGMFQRQLEDVRELQSDTQSRLDVAS